MKILKVINHTDDDCKIKYRNQYYKIPKNSNVCIEGFEDSISFEILDPIFYDFESFFEFCILFFILFIPYIICLNYDHIDFHYSFLCDCKLENDQNEVTLFNKDKELFVKCNENILNLKLNKKGSLSYLTLLHYCYIA